MLLIGIAFVAGNGFYVFQIFDGYSVSLPLLIVAFFQCIAVAWVYGNDRYNYMHHMTKQNLVQEN
jgi:SNF family Na+-dependent transporter